MLVGEGRATRRAGWCWWWTWQDEEWREGVGGERKDDEDVCSARLVESTQYLRGCPRLRDSKVAASAAPSPTVSVRLDKCVCKPRSIHHRTEPARARRCLLLWPNRKPSLAVLAHCRSSALWDCRDADRMGTSPHHHPLHVRPACLAAAPPAPCHVPSA